MLTKAKFLDINADFDRLSKELLISSSFMAPVAKFVQCKTDTALKDTNTVIAK